MKPRETCLQAAVPRQESLTVSATVSRSMSPRKVAWTLRMENAI